MRVKNKHRRRNRKGIAAVEAAVCLPLLIIIWFGTYEVTRQSSLKQQAQLLSSNAAQRILQSTTDFETIKADTITLAESLGLEGCQVEISRVDSDVVETTVSMDFAANSPISSLLRGQQVASTYFSYREE